MSTEMPNFHNIGNYMVSVAVNLFMGNIVTLGVHNDKLDEILDQNQALTTSWTTGVATGDVATQLKLIQNDLAKGDQTQAVTDFNDMLTKYMDSENVKYVSQFSQAVGSTLMSILGQLYSVLKDEASIDSTSINSYNGIVSATGNNEEQTGQNLGKTEGSVVQADAGAQQTFTGIVDAVEGFVSIVASLLQQLYS